MKMKKYLFGIAIATMALFTACDKDNEAAIYTPDGSNQGITFTTSDMGKIEVPTTNPQFTVEIYRGYNKGAFSGNVEAKGTVGGEAFTGMSVSGFSFAEGESKANITVDVSKLPVGKTLALTLAYTDSLNMGYANIEEVTMNVSLKIEKWVAAGTCTFIDYSFSESDEGDKAENVPIENGEGTNIFRIVNPYQAVYGTDTSTGISNTTNLEFTLSSNGDVTFPEGTFGQADSYGIYWDTANYGDYCYVQREGNDYYVAHLLLAGSKLYIGGFEFIWNR